MTRNSFRKISLIISILLFIVSLGLKGFTTINDFRSGIDCLLMGFLGLLADLKLISWLANPSIFIAWFLYFFKIKSSIIITICAIILMFLFLYVNEVIVNEAGQVEKIIQVNSGYYFWLTSSIVLLIASLIEKLNIVKFVDKELEITINESW